jgi:hypothetical protein
MTLPGIKPWCLGYSQSANLMLPLVQVTANISAIRTWYTLTTISPSGSLCWGCSLSGAGGGGGGGRCNRESLESVCMTRDTREMMGDGALVVICCDRSRCRLYTGASLYCVFPTYFLCCVLDGHSGLTLNIILRRVTNVCSNCHCVEIVETKLIKLIRLILCLGHICYFGLMHETTTVVEVVLLGTFEWNCGLELCS